MTTESERIPRKTRIDPHLKAAEQHEIVMRVGMLFERADAIDREVAVAGKRCERLTQTVLGKMSSGKL